MVYFPTATSAATGWALLQLGLFLAISGAGASGMARHPAFAIGRAANLGPIAPFLGRSSILVALRVRGGSSDVPATVTGPSAMLDDGDSNIAADESSSTVAEESVEVEDKGIEIALDESGEEDSVDGGDEISDEGPVDEVADEEGDMDIDTEVTKIGEDEVASTTQVTVEDEEASTADADDDDAALVEEEGVDTEVVGEVQEEATESAEDTAEPGSAEYAEETDYAPRYHEDDSAAFVDRMDLADDEGELDAGLTDDVALDVAAEREELERRRQESVASAAAAAAAAVEEDAPVTVQYMITRKMRQVLADDLGYTEEEVENMKPDVAAVITTKKLKRPSGGMPDAFYVDGKAPSGSNAAMKAMKAMKGLLKSDVVRKVIMPALAVGASALVAVVATKSGAGKSLIASSTGSIVTKTAEEPFSATLSAASDYRSKKRPEAKIVSAPAAESSSAVSHGRQERSESKVVDEELLDETALKFRTSKGNLAQDLDQSWLDRGITSMLEGLESMFRIPRIIRGKQT